MHRRLHGRQQLRGNFVCTDRSGRYSVTGLPAGSYEVHFAGPPDYANQWYSGSSDRSGAQSITMPADLIGVRHAALTPTNTISGTVTDSVTGQPLSGASAPTLFCRSDILPEGLLHRCRWANLLPGLAPDDYQLAFSDGAGTHSTQW